CGHEVKLIHSKSVRGGRRKQVMVVTVQNVVGYTGIFYWMVWRRIDEDGITYCGVDAKDAFILTEHGGLVRFAHQVSLGLYGTMEWLPRWKLMSQATDTIDATYHDWGSISNRKQGAAIYEVWPELGGTTGEKTGLIEYLEAGGYRPVVYLKLWRKYRGLENLCKQGQARLVAQIINASWRFAYQFESEADPYIDLKRKKPHEMLRMTKGEFRQVRMMGLELNIVMMREWKEYCFRICGSFQKYLEDVERFGGHLSRMIELAKRWGDGDTDKVCRFLEKQGLCPGEVGLLVDTREIAARLYGDRVLTREELWPRWLQEAHDRYARMLAEREDREKSSQLAEGFQRVIDWYGCLEWTDGELSVILPRSNHELVQEGDVLRHCVGAYGESHAGGTSLIFFIRRYRRPERSYYTLNISMKGRPKEIQLHGYGNERHGPNKEYSHKIPAKVRAFCDRWENEVLLPWYHRRQEEQKKEMSA
ncbi:MAG: PcfJ domain-containing protein, partial [Oscillospiraceae bacterium]|nr:PcfJ domain-containing protein [Oscillospiraceae bacterium]